MNDSRYVYNNEAIGVIAIASVLKEAGELSYSKTMLIIPFLFHQETITYFKRSNAVIRSVEEMIIKKVGNFGNFQARYQSLLPVSVNAIMILQGMGEIKLGISNIQHNSTGNMDLNTRGLGRRAEGIVKAATKLSFILQSEAAESLYLKLRIQL